MACGRPWLKKLTRTTNEEKGLLQGCPQSKMLTTNNSNNNKKNKKKKKNKNKNNKNKKNNKKNKNKKKNKKQGTHKICSPLNTPSYFVSTPSTTTLRLPSTTMLGGCFCFYMFLPTRATTTTPAARTLLYHRNHDTIIISRRHHHRRHHDQSSHH